ncbi:MAG: type II toxin-antitoxin system VapC family toxin [Planctomycetota bacterium]
MSRVFLETSSLLRAIFREAGGAAVERRLRGAERIVASRLLRVEAERAVLRAAKDEPPAKLIPDLQREVSELWPSIDFMEMTHEVCALAGRIAPRSRLRALDAIHLATFEIARRLDPSLEMLTHDERLLRAL